MELVESNSGLWTLLLAAACAGLGVLVYDRLRGEPPPVAKGTAAILAAPVPTDPADTELAEVRLAGLKAYAEIAERPLFRKDRRPPPPVPDQVDPQAVAEAIEELYMNAELRKKLAGNGRELVVNKFNLETCVEPLIDEFRKRIT